MAPYPGPEQRSDTVMRITLFVIALTVAAAPAMADPRIIVVENATPLSGRTPV